ncbi:MAG: NF038122 family metalloprotease [Cyanobacteria bacterium J06626_6]
MVQFNFTYDASVGIEQRIGFEMAAAIWSSVLKDDIAVNLHIGATNGLDNEKAVGGAVPILHKQNYGVFQEYYQQDATLSTEEDSPSADEQAIESLQTGNTVALSIDGEVVDGNSTILLTSAQAKALGMDKAITLDNGTTWDRDLVSTNGLDGYIVVNNSFDWNYDFTRSSEATEGSLDFLSMALHEIGHNLGFVSGLDGAMDVLQLHSGKTQIQDFTALDLFRHTTETANIENADGSVSSVSIGDNAYFSLDGGTTNLGDFSTGQSEAQGGDGYQASHWKRMQDAMGIMDPTLAYKERTNLSQLDLQALDVLGWDVNYQAIESGLDLEALLLQAEQAIATDLNIDVATFTNHRLEGNTYSLGYGQLWQLFESQMLALGYGQLWQAFELSYGQLWQEQAEDGSLLELGYGQLWQKIEDGIFELGYGQLWQSFEEEMFQLGYGQLWHTFELGYGQLWQQLDTHLKTLRETNTDTTTPDGDSADPNQNTVVSGGNQDDILAGSASRDLVSGGGGDDLIDGKAGNDILLGEAGNDLIYGLTGNDSIYGGDGDDFLAGEADNDKLYGEAGADILSGGYGHDLLDGGDGKDTLKGDAGNDILSGGAGDDSLEGGEGSDILIGETGQDIAHGGAGDDVIYGDRHIIGDATNTEEASEPTLAAIAKEAGIVEQETNPVDFWLRLEAEDFDLKNFNVENSAEASGQSIAVTGGDGKLRTDFSGPAGIYDVVVGYYADSNSEGDFELEISTKSNGRGKSEEYEWSTNQGTTNGSGTTDGLVTHTIKGVQLASGYRIELEGEAERNQVLRVDYIDFVAVSESNTATNAEFYDGSLYQVSQAGSWEAAEAEAEALGGKLVTVDDRHEKKWLERTFGDSETFWVADNGSGEIRLGSSSSSQLRGLIEISASDSQTHIVQDKSSAEDNALVRIEAENMSLGGAYQVESRQDHTSGSGIIESTSAGGTASTVFTGESGIYNVYVGYLDEDDGQSTASISINGQTLSGWTFNLDTNSSEYRIVGHEVSLNTGDAIEIEGRADSREKAGIDFLDFRLASASGEEGETFLVNSTGSATEDTLKVEAEAMSLSGDYKIKKKDFASGERFIEAEDDFSATTKFTGETGRYNVVLGYYYAKGSGQITAKVDGVELDQWQHTNYSGKSADEDNFVTRTLATDILLSEGAVIDLDASYINKDGFNIDYLKFVAFDPDAPIKLEAEDMNLSGSYEVKNYNFASGGSVLRSKSSKSYNALKMNSTFTGDTGVYDIIVGYYDGEDGEAKISASVEGTQIDSWRLTRELGSKEAKPQTFMTRTISAVTLTQGDVFELLSQRDDKDYGYVDYVEFVPHEAGAVDSVASSGESFKLEVEDMQLSGKVKVKEEDFASGEEFVRAEDEKTGFTASELFMGETGYYDIVVGYYDLEDGHADVAVKLNEEQLDRWLLDEDLYKEEDSRSFTTRTVASGIKLTHASDVLQITASQDDKDEAAIDYIKFVAVEPPPTEQANNTNIEPSESGDVLRGGAGNDKIYGGEGNDILYGEDEFDVGIATTENNNDLLQGGNGDDTLYGNSGDDVLYGDSDIVILPEGEVYNGSLYLLTDSEMSWEAAQLEAVRLGGNLVTLNNAAEENWIKSTFGNATMWTGLNDVRQEGEYEWASGESSSYTNWSYGNPDNWYNQDYVVMNYQGYNTAGQWSDEYNEGGYVWQYGQWAWQGNGFRGLVEIEIPEGALIGGESTEGTTHNDNMSGGSGNDVLEGGIGDDTLDGSDAIARGAYETDILGGGQGADRFVLGNTNQSYYISDGTDDYALIKDFNASVDVLQLSGAASNYQQQQQGNNLLLSHNQELIAILENVSSIDFNSASVVFV